MWYARTGKCAALIVASFLLTPLSQAAELSAERQASLKQFLIQDCGSCHGLRMKGGLGPALTPAELADKPVDGLVATIIHGRTGTAMPPWSALLTEQEAGWMIDQLLQGVSP